MLNDNVNKIKKTNMSKKVDFKYDNGSEVFFTSDT